MTSAREVAHYIIRSVPVDNLKLQKLLYYSQSVHLVLNNKAPLFSEPIEAWDYGPVVPPVYQAYKHYGFDPIPANDEPSSLALDELRSVDLVLSSFGSMTGTELINQTHHEAPWRTVYRPGGKHGIITIDSLYGYFKENLDFTETEDAAQKYAS